MIAETPDPGQPEEKKSIEASPAVKFSVGAIVSFISGIVTYLLIFLHSLLDMNFVVAAILAFITSLVAIFTGHKAKRRIRKAAGTMSGKKLANTGLILGWLYIVLWVLAFLIAILVLGGLVGGLGKLLGSLGVQ